jgi:hypothetical protein
VQSLAAWFLAEQPFMPTEDDYLVYTYNRFQACRFGLDAVYVDPATGEHMLREHILQTLDHIARHAGAHGASGALHVLRGETAAGQNDALAARTPAREQLLAEVSRQAALRFGASMGEFDLIARFFTRPVRRAALGVGDDCALLRPRPACSWRCPATCWSRAGILPTSIPRPWATRPWR